MKKILLVADAGGEIGWGHGMRMLAVAEELNGRSGTQTAWLTTTPKEIRQLAPPCPVELAPISPEVITRTSDAFLVDLPEPNPTWPTEGVWYMVDHGTGKPGSNRICPHFGAEERDWGPGAVVCGPRWMPLHKTTTPRRDRYDATRPLLCYRTSDDTMREMSDMGWRGERIHGGYAWWEHKWAGAVVPSSVIAYECMAVGIPVMLVPLPNDQPNTIGDAMVEAGLARWFGQAMFVEDSRDALGERAAKARATVDGLGASRIADLLERW